MEAEKAGVGDIVSRFDLGDLISGLVGDLRALRAGAISVRDAHARAELAKQILRGVHYTVVARQYLEGHAKSVQRLAGSAQRRGRRRNVIAG